MSSSYRPSAHISPADGPPISSLVNVTSSGSASIIEMPTSCSPFGPHGARVKVSCTVCPSTSSSKCSGWLAGIRSKTLRGLRGVVHTRLPSTAVMMSPGEELPVGRTVLPDVLDQRAVAVVLRVFVRAPRRATAVAAILLWSICETPRCWVTAAGHVGRIDHVGLHDREGVVERRAIKPSAP